MRRNGILMHISSLPSNYGIGTFGQEAYQFVDYLKKSGQSVWQILPLNPTGFGNSPYASYSSFAGNPYFIDLDLLEKDGLLYKEEYQWLDWGENEEQVDFGKIYRNRFPLLKKAAKRFLNHPDKEYEAFKLAQKDWLKDYALFMALKDLHNGKPVKEWAEQYRIYDLRSSEIWAREYKEEMEIQNILQYLFFQQWKQLKKYANAQGIQIIGDLPFYMAADSVDVWSHPELFLLGKDNQPNKVAGCSPVDLKNQEDKGQVWGNPLYHWPAHKKDGYDWWIRRILHGGELYDIVRIDHFQGFDTCFAVDPEDAKINGARNGKFLPGPGMELFHALARTGKEPEIIVEDLGTLTPSLQKLMKEAGYPGMKVLEYAFYDRLGERALHLPYNYPKNSVAYTGTHDNDTLQGWIQNTKTEDVNFAREFIRSVDTNNETFAWDLIRTLLASASSTTILQAQDLKALGNWARMNQPDTVGDNWVWRIRRGALDHENAMWVRRLLETYSRLPEQQYTEPCKLQA